MMNLPMATDRDLYAKLTVRVADFHVSIDGRDRPRKAMKIGRVWAIVNRWRSGQMSFDFGEVETVCKFDVGVHCVNG